MKMMVNMEWLAKLSMKKWHLSKRKMQSYLAERVVIGNPIVIYRVWWTKNWDQRSVSQLVSSKMITEKQLYKTKN